MNDISFATTSDILWMVHLSFQKRQNYERHNPAFWKMSHNSNDIQIKYFSELIGSSNSICLCMNDKSGFIIGNIIGVPEVYSSGKTLYIDDFCISCESLWQTVGSSLLSRMIMIAQTKDVKQILVNSGNFDVSKCSFLESSDLKITSNWYAKNI